MITPQQLSILTIDLMKSLINGEENLSGKARELQELINSLSVSIYIEIETDVAVLQRFLPDLYRLFNFLFFRHILMR